MNGVSYVVSFFGTIMKSTKSAIERHVLNPVLNKSCSENLTDRRIAKIAIAIFNLVSFGQFSSYKQSFFKWKIEFAARYTDTEYSNIDMLKRYLSVYSGKFEADYLVWGRDDLDRAVSSPLCFAVASCQPTAVEYLLNEKCSTDDIEYCLKAFFMGTLTTVYANLRSNNKDPDLNEERFLKILSLLLKKVSGTPFDFDICFEQMPKYTKKSPDFVEKIIELLVQNGAHLRDRLVFNRNALCENYYEKYLAAIHTT